MGEKQSTWEKPPDLPVKYLASYICLSKDRTTAVSDLMFKSQHSKPQDQETRPSTFVIYF